ncbi:sucrose-6-phosphate hydrolase-like [Maniola jurtina]|uniref:sucrose-6-phosphate hydrolase-like n=1 Tax=Maniola jurtina TaxID=191418 RepID=UPI001E686CAA|nr:sucrose-6-phosphate hydrolase-like [Maniola jurtina]
MCKESIKFKMFLVRSGLLALCLVVAARAAAVSDYETAKAELEEYIRNKRKDIDPRFRPLYHVAPPVGWMNDPNGFSYHKGEFHLFYQFYPYDSVWGPMHWGHVTSRDLVNWEQRPTALLPEREQCFSGGAITQGDQLVLMYTAHAGSDVEPFFNETQYLAFSDDAMNFHKYEGNPVIARAPNGSPDFRDPKVWKHGDDYYSAIGSKTWNDRGLVLLYKSKDLKDWEFLSVIAESNGEEGYMWECPDFFELDGKFVLLISPQGMEEQGDRYKNTNQNGYIIGSFSYDTNQFVPEVGFQEIDFGHDFYAAQTVEANGKRYISAWFNMWGVPHHEAVDGWAGMLTIPRELRLVNNRVTMNPVEELVSLRDGVVVDGDVRPDAVLEFGKAVELIIESDLNQKVDIMLDGREGGNSAWLRWDPEVRKVVVDRGSGDVRQVEWAPVGSKTWRVFLDASSVELFCGDGEVVLSSRVHPLGGWRLTNQSPQTIQLKAYNLRRSVPE